MDIKDACCIQADSELYTSYHKKEVKTIFKDEVPTFKFSLDPKYCWTYCTYYMKGLFEVDEDAEHIHLCCSNHCGCSKCIVEVQKKLNKLKSQ